MTYTIIEDYLELEGFGITVILKLRRLRMGDYHKSKDILNHTVSTWLTGATWQKAVLKTKRSWAVVVHACNPGTWQTEEGRFLSSRPAWSTE